MSAAVGARAGPPRCLLRLKPVPDAPWKQILVPQQKLEQGLSSSVLAAGPSAVRPSRPLRCAFPAPLRGVDPPVLPQACAKVRLLRAA